MAEIIEFDNLSIQNGVGGVGGVGGIGESPQNTEIDREYSDAYKERGLAQSLTESEIDRMDAEYGAKEAKRINDAVNAPLHTYENTPEGTYLKKLAKVESGGNYNASNKSGAYGKYQFMPATEKAVAAKLGMTIEEARTPEGQEAMIRQFTKDNRNGLKRNGIPVTDETLWWAHNQGLGGAINLYKDKPLSSANLKANGGNSNAEYINRWRKVFGAKSGLASAI